VRAPLSFFLLVLTSLTLGCSSARMSDHESDRLFRQGSYEDAARRLGEGVKKQSPNGRDLLLYLLDEGLSLHSAGKYEESNKVFRKADDIADIKDYTSLAAEGATLLTSDNIKDYKGEDFEKVLINTYLAMNYALMGDYENALVEARRVNRKLHLMVTEGQRKYKQNAFTRYLSAMIYEAERNYNDAYIDYKLAWELEPGYPGLGRDLWRTAWLLDMTDQMEKWDKEYKLTREDHEAAKALAPRKGKGEIIVLYENGISPIKREHPSFHSIPKFYPRFNSSYAAAVEVNGKVQAKTAVLHDIESTAISNLDEKYAGIIAKKVAGLVAKEAIGYTVARTTNSPLLGLAAKLALYMTDQADTRSWNLLPRDLQVARVVVEPGTYTVKVIPEGGAPLPEKTIQVKKGKKVFVNFRFTP
jgi:uncharacterized protein